MLGTYALSAGYYDAYYLKAQKVRTLIRRDFEQAFADVRRRSSTPTAPTTGLPHRREDRRPAADVPVRHLHHPGQPGRACRPVAPVRLRRARPADRPADHRPARSARRPSSARPTPTSRRPSGTTRKRNRCDAYREPSPDATRSMEYEAVIGLEVHAQLLTESKIFCGCSTAFGARAELPAPARSASACPGRCRCSTGGSSSSRSAPGSPRNCRDRAAQPLRAQELLLPRPAQGLPDQPVRAADLPRRARSTSRSRAAPKRDRHHPHPHGGGRRQEHPRRRTATRACVDFNRAGVPLLEIVSEPDMRIAGRGGRLPAQAAPDRCQYLEICDGNMEEGSFRCDANVSVRPRRQRPARHQGRDQEHELLPRRRAGDRVRDRAPDRRARATAARSCRRRGCGTRTARRPARCAARRRRTTTATSPSPTCCRSRSSTRLGRGRAARRCPSCPTRGARASSRELRPARLRRRGADRAQGRRRLLRGGGARARATPRRSATG